MCDTPHKAVATPFAARRSEVLNKVIHKAAGPSAIVQSNPKLTAEIKVLL
jgi:hypothetical protein